MLKDLVLLFIKFFKALSRKTQKNLVRYKVRTNFKLFHPLEPLWFYSVYNVFNELGRNVFIISTSPNKAKRFVKTFDPTYLISLFSFKITTIPVLMHWKNFISFI